MKISIFTQPYQKSQFTENKYRNLLICFKKIRYVSKNRNLCCPFIKTMTLEEHVEKDVIVTGPVGSGKTLLGLEAINIKKSHYKKKYGISSSDCQNQIRVIIVIGRSEDGSQLKQQLEKSESHNDCSLDITTELYPDSEKLTRIFQANKHYNSYKHTLILMDEIRR